MRRMVVRSDCDQNKNQEFHTLNLDGGKNEEEEENVREKRKESEEERKKESEKEENCDDTCSECDFREEETYSPELNQESKREETEEKNPKKEEREKKEKRDVSSLLEKSEAEKLLLKKKISLLESYVEFLHSQLSSHHPPFSPPSSSSFHPSSSPFHPSSSSFHPSSCPKFASSFSLSRQREETEGRRNNPSNSSHTSVFEEKGRKSLGSSTGKRDQFKSSPEINFPETNSPETNSPSTKSAPSRLSSSRSYASIPRWNTSTPIFDRVKSIEKFENPRNFDNPRNFLPNKVGERREREVPDFPANKKSESRKYKKQLTLRSPSPRLDRSKDPEIEEECHQEEYHQEEYYHQEEFEETVTVEEETIMFKKRKPIQKELTPKVTEMRPESGNGESEEGIDITSLPAGVPTYIDDPADNGAMTHLQATTPCPRPVSPMVKKVSKASLKRLKDLKERNQHLPPHLRSSYVVEQLPGLEPTFCESTVRADRRI